MCVIYSSDSNIMENFEIPSGADRNLYMRLLNIHGKFTDDFPSENDFARIMPSFEFRPKPEIFCTIT